MLNHVRFDFIGHFLFGADFSQQFHAIGPDILSDIALKLADLIDRERHQHLHVVGQVQKHLFVKRDRRVLLLSDQLDENFTEFERVLNVLGNIRLQLGRFGELAVLQKVQTVGLGQGSHDGPLNLGTDT